MGGVVLKRCCCEVWWSVISVMEMVADLYMGSLGRNEIGGGWLEM